MSIKFLPVNYVVRVDYYGWADYPKTGIKSMKFVGKGVLKEEHTYCFIFSRDQYKEYKVFCDGIAEMGWDVIFSATAMNRVHAGRNRNFFVVIEKKEVANEEGSGVRPVPEVQS